MGHTYLTELTFSFKNTEDIGYAIDFKEIKRVFIQFLQDKMDHGMILNPQDTQLIETTRNYNSKLWLMSLNGWDYCNPSVENITKEVFLSINTMVDLLYRKSSTKLKLYKVKMYETPNCYSTCKYKSITRTEELNFLSLRFDEINKYVKEKGIVEYDDRKL